MTDFKPLQWQRQVVAEAIAGGFQRLIIAQGPELLVAGATNASVAAYIPYWYVQC